MRRIRAVLIVVALALALLIIPAWRGSFSNLDSVPAEPAQAPLGASAEPRPRGDWLPPKTQLPPAIVDVADTLFAQGFGDPRNCEYREVELAVAARPAGNALSTSSPLPATHAWVVPSEMTDAPRLAVAWNGLLYPVKKIGPPVDLDVDVQAILKSHSKHGAANPSGSPTRSQSVWTPLDADPATNLSTASQHSLTPAKVMLLLRLGRADLAEALWRAGTRHGSNEQEKNIMVDHAWYLGLASAWAWALYERAATAHSLRDDSLALVSLRELARIQPLIEAQAAAYHLPRPRNPLSGNQSYLQFLDQLPEFLADQTNRSHDPGPGEREPSSPSDRTTRLARLIHELNESSPRRVFVTTLSVRLPDPISQALVNEGEDAVEPLLECLEEDNRLTRSVDHDLLHSRRWIHIHPVYEVAHTALCEILDTRQFGSSPGFLSGSIDRPRRSAVAAEIRAYWKRTRGVPRLDRYLAILADNTATPTQWLDAAEVLAQPRDVHGRNGVTMIERSIAGKVPPLRGEPLRDRVHPSVTELMAQRARELDPAKAAPALTIEVARANRMAELLAAWDPAGSRQVLAARVDRLVAITGGNLQSNPYTNNFSCEIGKLTLLRVKAGDPTALNEYARWLSSTFPPEHGFFNLQVFEPLWWFADRPPCITASNALFADVTSKWTPLFHSATPRWFESGFLSDLVISPLLGLAPFRNQVIASLSDHKEEGTIHCDASGEVKVSASAGWWIKLRVTKTDPLRPPANTLMELRRCDLFAWKLQQVHGLPRFELYWPDPLRQHTIVSMIGVLQAYGERLQHSALSQTLNEADGFARHDRAVLTFPQLDHPATTQEVAAGRAIFSLAPALEVRTVRLPAWPTRARWTALEIRPDDPGLAPFDLSNVKPLAQIEFLKEGRVWQAEEVRDAGSSHRYYGFVGRHDMTRVPAEEIDFPMPPNTGWFTLSRDLDGRLVPPGVRDDGQYIGTGMVSPSDPLPIVVTIRNRRGIAASAPMEWNRPGPRPAVRNGVTIRVFRRSGEDHPPSAVKRGTNTMPSWLEIAPRRQPEHYPSDENKVLEPAETARVLNLDLRDLFKLSPSNEYFAEVVIDSLRTPEGAPGHLSGAFRIEPSGGHPAGN